MGFFSFGRRRRRKRKRSPEKCERSINDSSTLSSVPVSEIKVPTYHYDKGWTEAMPWETESLPDRIEVEDLDKEREVKVSVIDADAVVAEREANDEKSVDPIRMNDREMVQRIIEGLKDHDQQLVEKVQERWKKLRSEDDPGLCEKDPDIEKAKTSYEHETTEPMDSGQLQTPREEIEGAVLELVLDMADKLDKFRGRMGVLAEKFGILSAPALERAVELHDSINLHEYTEMVGADEAIAYIIDVLELIDLQEEMGYALCTAVDNLTTSEVEAKEILQVRPRKPDVVDALG